MRCFSASLASPPLWAARKPFCAPEPPVDTAGLETRTAMGRNTCAALESLLSSDVGIRVQHSLRDRTEGRCPGEGVPRATRRRVPWASLSGRPGRALPAAPSRCHLLAAPSRLRLVSTCSRSLTGARCSAQTQIPGEPRRRQHHGAGPQERSAPAGPHAAKDSSSGASRRCR